MHVKELFKYKDPSAIRFISAQKSVHDAAVIMERRKIGFLIIRDGEKIVGIVSERDIVYKAIKSEMPLKETSITEIMTKNIKWGSMEDTLMQIVESMKEGNFRHMPIKSSDGEVKGIITERDLTGYWYSKHL